MEDQRNGGVLTESRQRETGQEETDKAHREGNLRSSPQTTCGPVPPLSGSLVLWRSGQSTTKGHFYR